MFGNKEGKGDGKELVGAKEKLKRAQMLKAGLGNEEIKSKREGKQAENPPATIAMIYALACILAFFLSNGPWKDGVRFKTGHDGLDYLLFNSHASFFGDPAFDLIVIVIARGLMIFALAGLLPLAAVLWIRGLDRSGMNPFRTVWGVTIGIGVVYFAIVDLIIPMIESLL